MREEVWTKEESAAVDALLAVLIDNQRIAIGGEIRGLLKAAHEAERQKILEGMKERHDFGLINSPYRAVLGFLVDEERTASVGDIVTWEDAVAGHGTFDGKVVGIEAHGVFASAYRGDGVHYSLVPFERIINVRTPEKKGK